MALFVLFVAGVGAFTSVLRSTVHACRLEVIAACQG